MSARGADVRVKKAVCTTLAPKPRRRTGLQIWQLHLDCGHVVIRTRNGPFASAPRRVLCEACALGG